MRYYDEAKNDLRVKELMLDKVLSDDSEDMRLCAHDLGNYFNEIPELKEYLILEKYGLINNFNRGIISDIIKSSNCDFSYMILAYVFSRIMTRVEGEVYIPASVPTTFRDQLANNMELFNIFIVKQDRKQDKNFKKTFLLKKIFHNLNDNLLEGEDGICIPDLYDERNKFCLLKNITSSSYYKILWNDKVEDVGRFTYLKDFMKMLVVRQYQEGSFFNERQVIALADEFVEDMNKCDDKVAKKIK